MPIDSETFLEGCKIIAAALDRLAHAWLIDALGAQGDDPQAELDDQAEIDRILKLQQGDGNEVEG